ncbi:MAG: hypothetical protein IJS81_07340 [Selenomonadaceae bacterium]|nr:hypothetical protein [Selenomonadaceae bacterium]MBQ7630010.1 hypothetical protein [Selenomonadaceae bacterium]
MVTVAQLKKEGLIPPNANATNGPVAFGEYDCTNWGYMPPANITKMKFSDNDFHVIYLQLEEGRKNGQAFQRIAVKMNCEEAENSTKCRFEKERVRRTRQEIQDYFVRNVAGCRGTKFQWNSPKDGQPHAYYLTVCRVDFDEYNYKVRIRDIQRAFDELK